MIEKVKQPTAVFYFHRLARIAKTLWGSESFAKGFTHSMAGLHLTSSLDIVELFKGVQTDFQ